jgi:transposase
MVTATEVAHPFQAELPCEPIRRHLHVHIGCYTKCGRRVQGRHPLLTSDALAAATSQIVSDAQAAIVTFNQEMGLSHNKCARTRHALCGLDLSRWASAPIVGRVAERLQPAHQEIIEAIQQAERLPVDETGRRIGGKPAWLHVWVSEQATSYTVAPQGSVEVLERVSGIDWKEALIQGSRRTIGSPRRFISSVCCTCCVGRGSC